MSDKSQFSHGLTKSNNNCILLGSLSSSSKHRTDTCHFHAAYDTVYHLISYIYHVIPYYLWKSLLLIQKSFHIIERNQWDTASEYTKKIYINRIYTGFVFLKSSSTDKAIQQTQCRSPISNSFLMCTNVRKLHVRTPNKDIVSPYFNLY